MKKTIVGKRTGPLYCMDMACKFMPPSRPRWYGHGFAIGDRAWTHVYMLDWRIRHPDARLLLTDRTHKDPTMRTWAGPLDAQWLGSGIVDEIWETDYPEEPLPNPKAYPLYHVPMGRLWRWIRHNTAVRPTIRPKPEAMESARRVLQRYGVRTPFITMQPLFDAAYNTYRNASPDWWAMVCHLLSTIAPVVIVGAHWNAKRMPVPIRAIPIWKERLSTMETLAIVNQASVHVGGETGVTIWAPIFKVPTVAVYKDWGKWESTYEDVRPISFGAPVVPARLNGLPADVVKSVAAIWR